MNTSTPNFGKKCETDKKSKTPLTPCRRVGLGRPLGSLKKTMPTNCLTTPRINESEKSQTPINIKHVAQQLNCHNGSNDRLKISLTSSDVLTKELATGGNLSLPRTNSMNVKRALCDYGSLTSLDDQTHDLATLPSNDCLRSGKIKTERSQKSAKKRRISSDQNLNHEHLLSDPSSFVNLPRLHVESSYSKPTSNNEDVTTDMIHKLVSSIKEKRNRLDLMRVQQTYSRKHNLEDLRAQSDKWRLAGQDALRYSLSLAKSAGFPVTIKQLIDDHGFSADLIQYNEEDDDFV